MAVSWKVKKSGRCREVVTSNSSPFRCGLAPTGWEMPDAGTVHDVFCSSEAFDPEWEKEAIVNSFGPFGGPRDQEDDELDMSVDFRASHGNLMCIAVALT